MMVPAGFRPFSDLVDRLYAAALRPDRWPAFLEAATAMFGGTHAFVSQLEDRRRPTNYVGLPRPGRSTHPVDRYEDVVAEDPRQRIFTEVGRVTHCRMGLSDEQVKSSRAYREYLQPLDFEYTLHARVLASGNVSHSFGINRDRASRAFGAADCDLMNELMPHLTRAFEIQRAIQASRPIALPSTPAKDPETASPDIRLRSLFGMPPAQARLAALLLEGRTITEAANALGITVGSARQYLRGIFHATGVRRQADLIRVVSEALRR